MDSLAKEKRGRKDNGNESKPQQRWNRKAIRCNEGCRHQDECKYKYNCCYLPAGNQIVTQSKPEEKTQFVQQTERMNFTSGKQRMHVKTSLEIVKDDIVKEIKNKSQRKKEF